ncbi:tRNA synthetases class I (M) [Mesorhizobium sp. YR577]|nr:tRNA synthetases class I (M) [Mesorhizobium sp. YR577]
MNSTKTYITTSIPYVNAAPHVGFALELVQADAYARHSRLLGKDVRFQCGTDDNSLKNVRAAEAAGRPVAEFVGENADRFEQLGRQLQISNDAFVRTSMDTRHIAPGMATSIEKAMRAFIALAVSSSTNSRIWTTEDARSTVSRLRS